MNRFGRIFSISIWGESHGPAVGCVIDGCPPGLPITPEDFLPDLERRRGGVQRATTPRKENDIPEFLSGVFNGFTTGSPVSILFRNSNTRGDDYLQFRDIPRPGHADFVASKKFGGFEDYRGGGHFSGRLTAPLVAAGTLAKKILQKYIPHFRVHATVIQVGGYDNIEEGINYAIAQKDSVGALVRCVVDGLPVGLPVGLGEPFFDSVESLIAHAVFSIPAIKGIEFGAGFNASKMVGTAHNDAIMDETGRTKTNHSGGINGGLTNGNALMFTVVVKPASSTPKQQQTFNFSTGKEDRLNIKGRHDLIIGLRVPPVLEAVTALVLADLILIENSRKA